MRRLSIRELSLGLIVAVVVAALYNFWLTFPILRILTVVEWSIVATFAAAILGGVSALIGLRTYSVLAAVAAGLTLGGAWVGFSTPNDVPTTFLAQFVSHLGAFWKEVVMFTAASVASNICCAYLLREKSKST